MNEPGTVIWHFETADNVVSSPTVVDETVYFGSDDSNVYAVDAKRGTEQWRFETGDSVHSSPVVVDATVYIGSDDGNRYAISAGVTGSSEDSRVRQGALNHHYNREEESQNTVIESAREQPEEGEVQKYTKASDQEQDSIIDDIMEDFDDLGG